MVEIEKTQGFQRFMADQLGRFFFLEIIRISLLSVLVTSIGVKFDISVWFYYAKKMGTANLVDNYSNTLICNLRRC